MKIQTIIWLANHFGLLYFVFLFIRVSCRLASNLLQDDPDFLATTFQMLRLQSGTRTLSFL